MGWRFRKSFSPIPGVRLTLSPSGISTSVGVGPLRFTAGTQGPAVTARIPGTGISFRQPLKPGAPPRPAYVPVPAPPPLSPALAPAPALVPLSGQTFAPAMEEIKSAGSGALTTPGLAAFKAALQQASVQQADVSRELAEARRKEGGEVARYRSWADGWFMRRLFKRRFAEMQALAADATALREELEEQEQLSHLQTEIEMPDGVAKAFHRLCDDFAGMAGAQRIWDNIAHRSTNRVAERTAASRTVDRRAVRFALGKCGVIETAISVPHFQNANGGDLYLYPGFMVYFASPTNFALLEYPELQMQVTRMRFIEEEGVPADAQVVAHAWAKSNKDGSPDRRFSGNYQIPVAEYAKLVFSSETGLNEEYLISAVGPSEAFAQAWQGLCSAVALGA